MVQASAAFGKRPKSPALKGYFPLILFGVGLLLALTLLPSALSVPRSDLLQSLEYAPVAPHDKSGDPPGGDMSSLSLGSTGGLRQQGSVSEADRDFRGGGARPSNKRCVGRPPRQTEDPLAPPCVAFFAGNNGGATAPGVTEQVVKIVYYQGAREVCDVIWDLAQPIPQTSGTGGSSFSNYADAVGLRAFQKYFNDRFQTYGRFVHFYLQMSGCREGTQPGPELARADAATTIRHVHPFALVNEAFSTPEAYDSVVAQAGIVDFVTRSGLRKSYFAQFPGRVWGYSPSLDQSAELFADFLCTRARPYLASFSGNTLDNGDPRKYALLHSDAATQTDLARLVADGFSRCGGRFTLTRNFPDPTYTQVNTYGDPQVAQSNMAEFATQQVTTIVWPGDMDLAQTHAAANINYRPEILALGVGFSDKNSVGSLQEQSVWRNAWVVTPSPKQVPVRQRLCYQAAKEGDPNISDAYATYACIKYPSVRQLFTAIQVAGPRLSARSLDQGMHAIPPIASEDPTVPACIYDRNDYTCVKDMEMEWWDPSGYDTSHPYQPTNGCLRMAEGGKRYLIGTWQKGDVPAARGPGDLCNTTF